MKLKKVAITVLGPTASGKTALAASLAKKINGEIISVDSRQVYKGLNIGSGKDLEEYVIDNNPIPHHLIDITTLREEYNVYQYQQDCLRAIDLIAERKSFPIFCGGTGLYLNSIVFPNSFSFSKVPEDKKLRAGLASKTDEELITMLNDLKDLHNTTDTTNRSRLIRAIEISLSDSPTQKIDWPIDQNIIFGISFERRVIKERITSRLKQRLDCGMIEEVEGLMKEGFELEKMRFLGLEYKFVGEYLMGNLNYNDMFQKLNTAIHAFAKRQMTWFRRMEKQGAEINWIEGELSLEEKLKRVTETVTRTCHQFSNLKF